jgi:hypothetical protein
VAAHLFELGGTSEQEALDARYRLALAIAACMSGRLLGPFPSGNQSDYKLIQSSLYNQHTRVSSEKRQIGPKWWGIPQTAET